MDDWKPQPRQIAALERPEFEVLYGGARGGGKTDAGLAWLTKYIEHPRYRALVIRKNSDDLRDWADRAVRLYSGYGAKKTGHPGVIKFPSGAIIVLGHLKDDQAYTKYQGQEYHRILIEELTQIPDERRYLQLIASCRSSIAELKPRVFATTNPGGVGHGWVKARFVDPSPPNVPFKDPISNRSRIFIPARVDDNTFLMEADPAYVNSLDALKGTDIDLWKAWRLGDWDTFAGQYFKEFSRDKHVINPFMPFKDNYIFVGGMDWGRAAPFAFYITSVELVTYKEAKFYRAKTFLEVYGTEKTPKEWAQEIKKKVYGANLLLRDIAWIRGDPAMFKQQDDGGISIADLFKENGISIREANNDRLGGWELMHKWLSIAPDGLPYWQITSNCQNLIRTLPSLIHDENKVEDVDTTGEDHGADATRYMFKHLKWLEGQVGGVKVRQEREKKFFTAKMDHGQQIAIDPDDFK